MVFRHHFLTGNHSILVVISLLVLWRLEVCVSCPLPPFPLSPQQRIPLNYSPLVSLATALFSFPMRYRHSGQSVTGHRRTSALFPQQQSRHLSRIALPLVILSSMRVPPSIRSQQLCRHPPLFLCPVCSSAVAAEVQRLAHFLDPVIDSLVFQALGIVQLCH